MSEASYGVGMVADVMLRAGRTCPDGAPCILGGGGGLELRGGWRWGGAWYVGGAYQVSRTDSSNLYRLPTLQQLRLELRYVFDLGYRTTPFIASGLGAVTYGDEFGAETGGGTAFAGVGVELQLSRLAALGMSMRDQPMLFAGFIDTAGHERPWGVAHYASAGLYLELRREVSGR